MSPESEMLVLAFFCLSENVDVEHLHRTIEEWSCNHGCVVNQVGLAGDGYPNDMEYRSVAGAKKLLKKNGYGKIKSLSLRCMPDNYTSAFDQIWKAYFSKTRADGNYFRDSEFLFSVCDLVSNFNSDTLEFVRIIVSIINPYYGIGLRDLRSQGPQLYASGAILSGALLSDKETDLISAWTHIGMYDQVYKMGLLRNVYRWNFLSSDMLDTIAVKGKCLRDWIKDGQRGKLVELGHKTSLWDVEDKLQKKIKREISSEGIIFDPKKYELASTSAIESAKATFIQGLESGKDEHALLRLLRDLQNSGLTRYQANRCLKEVEYYARQLGNKLWQKKGIYLLDRINFNPSGPDLTSIKLPDPAKLARNAARKRQREIGMMLKKHPPIVGTPVVEIDETSGSTRELSKREVQEAKRSANRSKKKPKNQ